MKYTLVALILMFSYEVSSTTYAQTTINDLYQASEFAGIVSIEEGKVVYSKDTICSVTYTAKVIESFNSKFNKGEQIVFGPYRGYGVGDYFLLFLYEKGRFNSENLRFDNVEKDKLKLMSDCHKVQPNLRVMFEGYGSLQISKPHQFDYEDAIKIPERYIKIPDELKKIEVEFGDDTILGNPYWVKSSDFIDYMHNKYKR